VEGAVLPPDYTPASTSVTSHSPWPVSGLQTDGIGPLAGFRRLSKYDRISEDCNIPEASEFRALPPDGGLTRRVRRRMAMGVHRRPMGDTDPWHHSPRPLAPMRELKRVVGDGEPRKPAGSKEERLGSSASVSRTERAVDPFPSRPVPLGAVSICWWSNCGPKWHTAGIATAHAWGVGNVRRSQVGRGLCRASETHRLRAALLPLGVSGSNRDPKRHPGTLSRGAGTARCESRQDRVTAGMAGLAIPHLCSSQTTPPVSFAGLRVSGEEIDYAVFCQKWW
jgi:hypothetical protein